MIFKLWLENEEKDIIVYHGSPTKISKFTTEFLGEGHDQEGPGIYFTTSESDAGSYGSYIHKAKLKPRKFVPNRGKINRKQIEKLILRAAGAENLMDLQKMDMDKFYDSALSNFDENPLRAFQDAVDNVIKYSVSPHDAFQNVWITHYRYNPQAYLKNMVDLGYDGVKIQKEGLDHYIIFNPEIIEILE